MGDPYHGMPHLEHEDGRPARTQREFRFRINESYNESSSEEEEEERTESKEIKPEKMYDQRIKEEARRRILQERQRIINEEHKKRQLIMQEQTRRKMQEQIIEDKVRRKLQHERDIEDAVRYYMQRERDNERNIAEKINNMKRQTQRQVQIQRQQPVKYVQQPIKHVQPQACAVKCENKTELDKDLEKMLRYGKMLKKNG
jgi:hypothetical protein